tara:strand:- start:17 stop:256 length:240 start_codon:yes stop_codon:yes gene_type:complete
MNFIAILFSKIRTLAPYFLIIFIYFIFVNFEAKIEPTKNKSKTTVLVEDGIIDNKDENNIDNQKQKNLRIPIPVIPFSE